MKRKQLEMALQKRSRFPRPDPSLEQYLTPAPIAADVLYWALAEGDVEGKSVLDLGCGTGIFAVGASLLGARDACGIDADRSALAVAKGFSTETGGQADFIAAKVGQLPLCESASFDTVIMNPPFGSQKRHADRPFVEEALKRASIVYSLHLAETRDFVALLARSLGAEVLGEKIYKFEIPHTYQFHRREAAAVDVAALRMGKAQG